MMLKWFGKQSWDAPACDELQRIPIPFGSLCQHCEELIDADSHGFAIPDGTTGEYGHYHYDCWMRQLIGSVAHLEHRCSCFVPGATEGDDPQLSPRQAASAAVRIYERDIPRQSIVHVLLHGLPLCGFAMTAPAEWPANHGWVDLAQTYQATCVECKDKGLSILRIRQQQRTA